MYVPLLCISCIFRGGSCMWNVLTFLLCLGTDSRRLIVSRDVSFFVSRIMVGLGTTLVEAICCMFLFCRMGILFLDSVGCPVIFAWKNVGDYSCCRFCV